MPFSWEFGEERLRALVIAAASLPAEQVKSSIVEQMRQWRGSASQHDDLTFVVLRVK